MNILKIAAAVATATLAFHANALVVTQNFDASDSASQITFSGTGSVVNTEQKNVTAKPTGSTGNWLTVGAGQTETINFHGLFDTVSFLWGSVDAYNTLTFSNGTTITGAQAFAPSNGSTSFTYSYTGSPFSSMTLSSTGNAFEIDNIRAVQAVPEPETYAMMAAGLGALVFVSRRRKA